MSVIMVIRRILLTCCLLIIACVGCHAQTLSISLPPFISIGIQNSVYSALNSNAVGGGVVNITGGTAPYTCTLISGSLPSGMTLSEVTPVSSPPGLCILSGTPTVAGSYPITIRVTDTVAASVSQSLTFLVQAATLPVISVIASSGVTATTATITWTTDVAADSQVAYGDNYPSLVTSIQDTAGVLSHSVALTNLLPSTGYWVRVISRGIASGSPRDYLLSFTDANSQSVFVTTSARASGGGLAFVTYGIGTHNVIQSYEMHVGIKNAASAGVSGVTTTIFQVTNLPASSKVHWVDQQDLSFGQGEVSTTATTDDTLTVAGVPGDYFPEFTIITNNGGTTPIGTTTLTVTVTTTGTVLSHSFPWTMNVIASSFVAGKPASQPVIPNLATFNSNLIAFGGLPATITNIALTGNNLTVTAANKFLPSVHVTFAGLTTATFLNTTTVNINTATATNFTATVTHADYPSAADTGTATGTWYNATQLNGSACTAGYDQCNAYYDGQSVYYRIQAQDVLSSLSGSPGAWTTAASNVRAVYRDLYVIPNAGAVPGYWVFPHGLYRDCVANSNATSCSALHQLASAWAGALMYNNNTAYVDALQIREQCYGLGTKRLDYDAGGATTLIYITVAASRCLGFIDQIVNGTAGWDQPFMNGLCAQALIEYYLDPKTGNRNDPRVPDAIQKLADYMWASEWIPWSGADGEFYYNSFQSVHGSQSLTGLGNLNLLVAPMYAWLYLMTGQTKYQLEGDTIFNAGVNQLPGNGIGFSGKNFSQQFRWSTDYVTWRTLADSRFIPPFGQVRSGTLP